MAMKAICDKADDRPIGNERNKQVHATVHVNINIDRSIFAGNVNKGSVAKESVMTESRQQSAAAEARADKNGREVKFVLGKDSKSKGQDGQGSGNAARKSIQSDRPSSGRVISDDRLISPTSTNELKAERSRGPEGNDAKDREDRTGQIWMVDDDESKGGVLPAIEGSNQLPYSDAEGKRPKPAAIGPQSQCGGTRESVIGPKPTAKKASTHCCPESWSICVFCPKRAVDVIYLILACFFIPIMCLFAPFLYSLTAYAFFTVMKASAVFDLIVLQMFCDTANAICERYGVACLEYCASGLQMQLWK